MVATARAGGVSPLPVGIEGGSRFRGVRRMGYSSILGGPVPDTTAPVATSSPVNASTIVNTDQITIDVTDNQGLIAQAGIYAVRGTKTEVIWDGSAFVAPYSGAASVITLGARYAFTRSTGWPEAALTVKVRATDLQGNALASSFAYTVSNPTDAASPVISVSTPGTGSTITATQAVAFNVTDDSGAVATVDLFASEDAGASWEAIYFVGSFVTAYAASTTGSVTNGTSFSLTRTSGWPKSVLWIKVIATDASGNRSVSTYTYGVSNPSGAIVPTVTNKTPAAGATLQALDTVSFDVTDNTGILFLEIQVDQIRREIVHDGDIFLDPYTTSTRSAISGGWHYDVRRVGGWAISPTFRVRVIDIDGQNP